MGAKYTMGTIAGLTGLSPHTIRAWEKRYQALEPGRTESNRRLYSDSDVGRLSLLKRVVDSGHTIGQVANLSEDQLRALDQPRHAMGMTRSGGDSRPFLSACMAAIDRLDPDGLQSTLVRASAVLGTEALLDGVVVPLLAQIESGWLEGSIRISHEHMASAVLRTFLENLRNSFRPSPSAPKLLVTTPVNQVHEIGALIVGVVAAVQAWSVAYLGPNLPAREIASAAKSSHVRAVALSIVFPSGDVQLDQDLLLLRDVLDPSIQILVGGRAARDYAMSLQTIGASVFRDLTTFRDHLHVLEWL